MNTSKFTVYLNERFYLQSTLRYYSSRNKTAGERLLHRRIWVEHNGPIPIGCEIHHVNEDWTDNRIGNLECIDASLHQRNHMLKRYENPDFRAASIEALKLGYESAKVWHASPEGLEWHSRNGKESWEKRASSEAICSCCGASYETFFPSRAKFCSRACEQKVNFQKYKTATGTCVLCGAEFFFNKYRKQDCCSRDCSNKLRAMKSKGIELPPADNPAATSAGY